jgi:transcriptional regulator with XRE-family HTH domain
MSVTDEPDRAQRQPGGKRPAPNLRLLKARMTKQLSVEELAELAGVSGKQIRLIERGKARNPHMRTKRSLAEALDQPSIEDLFPLRGRGGAR